MTTHICNFTQPDDDPDTARDLLERYGLPEDVIDGVLCLHAQELAAVQREAIRKTDDPVFYEGEAGWLVNLIEPEDAPAVPAGQAPATDRADVEPSDPTECSGDEGFCPEHGFHRHSLKQPGEPEPDTDRAGLRQLIAKALVRYDWNAGLAAVRSLHQPMQRGPFTICAHCSGWDGVWRCLGVVTNYPCPTLRALGEGPAVVSAVPGQADNETTSGCNCPSGEAPEHMFGSENCDCIPFTRQEKPPRYLNRPTDTVDMISGWEIGPNCPHHRYAIEQRAAGAQQPKEA